MDCKLIHYNYLVASRGLCEGGLMGLFLMLIASFLAACLLTVMVRNQNPWQILFNKFVLQIFIDSHTWIYIRKRNDYAQVEEQQYLAQQQQQQQMLQNHQNMAYRTLPRQQNG